MRELIELSNSLIEQIDTRYIREYIKYVDWNNRLIGIKGSRGVGKTTLLLQYIKINLPEEKVIYITLDDLYFTENKLIDFADDFVKNGGKYLFIDEVHHYKNWSIELKLIYDRYKDIKIVFTGSSILHLSKSKADLSRRAVMYKMPGLSLREYININSKHNFESYSLYDIIENHQKFAKKIWTKIKPIEKFNEYIKTGYYPYFLENKGTYLYKLAEVINLIIEADLPYITEISYNSIDKLKQLLYIIATSVPFKPNIQKISERIGMGKNTLKLFINYLNDAEVITTLYSNKKGISLLTKPEKIYLNHPNIMYALAPQNTDIGNIRETFFLNQLKQSHQVYYPEKGDFLVDSKYLFEVGGKSKTTRQIKNFKNAFLALDGIETGYKNQIPLWLFGFLY